MARYCCGWAAAAVVVALASSWWCLVDASNPFSSNVVALTSKNWREHVEDSPHAVFVNICRSG
jgi:hypothetical protein